jgi:uncharacterized protein (DUF3084 family)
MIELDSSVAAQLEAAKAEVADVRARAEQELAALAEREAALQSRERRFQMIQGAGQAEGRNAEARQETRPDEHEVSETELHGRERMLARGKAHLTAWRERLEEHERSVSERSDQLERAEKALRLREVRLEVDVELHIDKLEETAQELAAREERLAQREQDLARYVASLQQQIHEPKPADGVRVA